MNTPYKIVAILVAGLFGLAAFYYLVFKVPASPDIAPQDDKKDAVPAVFATPTAGSPAKIPQSVSTGGSYSRILGEADLDKNLFDGEVIDANSVTGDKAEFLSVGRSFDENSIQSADFCANLGALSAAAIAKIEEREIAVKAKRAELLSKINSGRKDRDSIRSSYKLQLSLMQDEYFANLSSKASNAGHKSAVQKYVSLIIDASSNRRTGVGSVTQTFRTAIDEAFLARTGLINSAVASYKASASAAFDKAKSDCASGAAQATVRTNLQSSLKAAKDKFNSDHAAAEKLSTVILPLIEQRKATIASVLSASKTSMENARRELKAAYPQAE